MMAVPAAGDILQKVFTCKLLCVVLKEKVKREY